MKLLGILSDFFKSDNTTAVPTAAVDTRDRWHLVLGQKILGELVFSSYETPWITADFFPTDNFSHFIPYFEWEKCINARLDSDAEMEESNMEVGTLIDEVNSLGEIRVVDLRTKNAWAPMLHFGDDYSYATFR